MSAGSERARARPRIVTTRPERGRLDSLLAAGGADVVHVALIATERVAEPGDLTRALASADWVAVTSQNGAAIVTEALGGADHPRLAAVGDRTATVLARGGALVEVVPEPQTAADLVAAFPDPAPQTRVVVVQAEVTDGVLAAGLRRRGYVVDEIVGYRTIARQPTPNEIEACRTADVITFASGSAAAAWVSLDVRPVDPAPTTVAIGPSTARRAEQLGLLIDVVAAEHSVDGLARTALAAAGRQP